MSSVVEHALYFGLSVLCTAQGAMRAIMRVLDDFTSARTQTLIKRDQNALSSFERSQRLPRILSRPFCQFHPLRPVPYGPRQWQFAERLVGR